jgi:predicted DNA binding CopG/RHH family protein
VSKYEIKVVGMGEERDAEILEMLEQAERDAEQEGAQVRVNFRWGAEQLALVKEAARVQGLPYQIYIKKALYDRASADLTSYYDLEAVRSGGKLQARSAG